MSQYDDAVCQLEEDIDRAVAKATDGMTASEIADELERIAKQIRKDGV